MSASGAWRRWLRRLTSRPESSRSGGGLSASLRYRASSDSLAPPSRHVAASVCRAVRSLRRGLAAAVFCVPLLGVFASGAAAQTTVPHGWELTPSGLTAGQQFRLLFITNSDIDGSSPSIGTYNSFVQTSAANGHAAIRRYGSQFRVVASTATVDARDNTSTTGTGVPIYWLNGSKVADNYGDFYDGSWDDYGSRNERGRSGDNFPITGSNDDGTRHPTHYLGSGTLVRWGHLLAHRPFSAIAYYYSLRGTLYALSPVFMEEQAPATTVNIAPTSNAAITEGGTASYTVSASPAPTANLTVNLSVADAPNADFVAAGNQGAGKTVTIAANTASATYTVATVPDSRDEPSGSVTVTVKPGLGYRAGGRSSAPVTVNDDDVTLFDASVLRSDAEEGTTDGAIILLRLKRGLSSGESLAVPLQIAGGTLNTDYELKLLGAPAGIGLTGSTVTFTGRSWGVTDTGAWVLLTALEDEDSRHDIYRVSLGALTFTGLGGGVSGRFFGNPRIYVTDTSSYPRISIAPTPNAAITEGGTARYTVSASPAPTANLTVNLSVADAPNADFVAAGNQGGGKTVTIAANTASATYTVATVTDGRDEPSGPVTVTVERGRGYVPGQSSAPVTVNDDDLTTVTLTMLERRATEDHITSYAIFDLDLNRALRAGESLAVPLQFAGGTLGTDFKVGLQVNTRGVTLSGSTVTFTGSSGGSSRSLRLVVVGLDDIDTTNETVTVSIPASSWSGAPRLTATGLGGGAVGTGNGQFTVIDDDAPATTVPEITIAPSRNEAIGEGGVARYTVSASPAPTANLTVNLSVADAPNADFVADGNQGAGKTVTIAANRPSAAYTVRTARDRTDEPNGPVTVTVAAGNGYNVGSSSAASVTVSDDDPTTVTLATPDKTATEGSGSDTALLRLDLSRALRAGESLAIPLQVAGGVFNTDYALTLSGAPAGIGLTGSTVTVIGSSGGSPTRAEVALSAGADSDDRDDTLTVSLGTLTAAGLGGGAAGTRTDDGRITVTDTTVFPVVTIVPGTSPVTEGAGASFTVSAVPAPAANLTVNLRVADAPNADFVTPGNQGAGKTVTIAADTASATYTVPTAGDSTDEPNGPVTVTVESGSGYRVGGQSSAPVTVNDDDATEVLIGVQWPRAREGGVSLRDAAVIQLGLRRALFAGESLAIPLQFSGGALGTDFTLRLLGTGRGGAPPLPTGIDLTGSTVTVSGSAGGSARGADIALFAAADSNATDETVTLWIPASSSRGAQRLTATGLGGGASGTRIGNGQITLDDSTVLPVVIITGGGAVTEGAGATYTVSANPAPAADLTVNLIVADAPNADFVTSTNQGTGKTVTVPTSGSAIYTVATVQDAIDEPSGPVTVTVQDGSGYTVGTQGSAAVTVNDDDATTVTLGTPDKTATEGSNADPALLRLDLNRALRSGESLTIPLRFAGGVLDTDFTLALSGSPTGVALSGSTVTVTGSAGGSATRTDIHLSAAADSNATDETVTVSIPASSSGAAPRLTATGLGGGATGTRNGNGQITLTDSNPSANNAPVFGSDALTRGVAENTAGGAAIGAVIPAATDADNDPLTYAIGGADAASFAFNASTRQISTQAALDHETKSSYSVTVTASDGNGGAATATVTIGVTDVDEPPAAPAAPTVSASTTSLNVSWTAPANAGKPAITSYDLQYRQGASGTWTNGPQDRTGTTAAITGLSAGTAYQVQVRATNAEGDGPWSPSGSASTTVLPEITITPGTSPVTEGAGASFTVSASPAPAANLTVNLRAADAPDADFVAAASEAGPTVILAAHTASATYTLPTVADGTDEPSGAVTVTVAAGAGYTPHATGASAAVTVRDDDATLVTLASPPGDISETGGTKTVTVTLGRALRAPESLTMPLALAGAAVRGTDYTVSAVPATGVTWAGLGGTSPTATFTGGAGASRTATLAFTAVDDGAAEGAEAVTVARGTPSANAHLHGGATGAGAVDFSIVERPTIGFSSATYTVDEGATLTVEMRLSTPWPNDIGTALKVVPGTAGTADYDYTLNLRNGIATYPFSFWKTQTVRVRIPTVQDALREGDETFTLRFAGKAGSERIRGANNRIVRLEPIPFGLREATVTIRDDETPAVGVVVSREALALDEGGAAGSYTVALRSAPAPGETVTVSATVDDAAVARVHTGADAPAVSATLVFTDADWSQARTVTVTPQGDADTGDERTRIAHAVSGPGAWDGVTAPAVAVTVADDDAVALPQVTVAVAAGAGATVLEGTAARFTVRAHPAPAAGLTVDLNVADAPHADFVASGDEGTRTVTIAPGASEADVTVTTVVNAADEPSGPVTVTVAPSTASPATYAVGSASTATVRVLDNDATAVTLAVTDPTATEGDAADTAAIALTLNRGLRTGERLRVPLQLSGGAPGTDFTLALAGSTAGVSLSGTTVTFTGAATPSAASATVRLAALPDPDTIDGTVTVSIPASSTGTPRLDAQGLGGGATGAGTGTVVLADAAAPLTVNLTPFPIETPPGQAGLPEGATVSFNLQLSRIPAADEVVLVPLVLGGDATWGADFTLSCAAYAGVTCSNLDSGDPSMTFDGGTLGTRPSGLLYEPVLRLHLVEDNTQESTQTVTLSLGDNTHSQGIVDAPDAVVVSFALNAYTATSENNGPIEPVMTVTPPAGRDIPLFFTIGGTATEGKSGDYYFGEAPVIAPGASRQSFPVQFVDDGVDELDETIILTLDTTRLPSWVTVGGIATATLTIADDDPTVVSLARTGPGALAEGAKTEFTVTLGRALLAGEVVGVPLEVSGAGVTTADWTLALKPGAANTGVTLSHETTATPRVSLSGAGARTAVLELTAVEDGVDDAETLTVALGPDGTGANGFDRPELGTTVDDGAGPHPSAHRFDVLVDVVAGVSVKPGPAVTEGARATFTVVVGAPRARTLQVALEVGQSGEYVDRHYQGILGRRFVHLRPGATSAAFTVPTANDETNEAHGAVTVRVLPGARYTPAAAPNDRATVTVNDDDGGLTGPALSVNDVTAREDTDHNAQFTVSLSPAPTGPVTVSYYTRESTPVSARSGEDYIANRGTLRFAPGETTKPVYVSINEDFHDEAPETFELFLAYARGGAWIADGVGVGTIVNDDPLPAAWLARFGRTVAEQALKGIADRRAASRTPGLRGTLAGQALSFDAPGDDDAALASLARRLDDADTGGAGLGEAESRTMTAREVLLDSRFTLTGAQDASGGTAAFWGRAAQGSFDGQEGKLALDGEVTTAMLGADYARDRWLVGLALTQSEGEGGWTDTEPDTAACPEGMDARTRTLCEGAVRGGDGKVESSLTAAIPYASLQASERVGLWGALSVGSGRVTLKPETGRSLAADTDWRMAAAGVRGELLGAPADGGSGGPALALTSDALWARTASEKTRDLAASQSDVTRLRLGLEGSYRFALGAGGTGEASGASLVPKLELGARHDGGDAETGFGIELGGGLAWDDPGLGLSLDLSGRILLAHEDDDLEDRGLSAALGFDPDPGTERGLSMSLRQELGGKASGGLDALFAPAPLDERTGAEATSRWTAEAAYGFPAFGGRYTASPHVGLSLATDARDYTLGWRWTPAAGAPDLSFGLEAVRRESDADAPEHAVGFEVRARW